MAAAYLPTSAFQQIRCDYHVIIIIQAFSDDSYTPTKNCNENVEK